MPADNFTDWRWSKKSRVRSQRRSESWTENVADALTGWRPQNGHRLRLQCDTLGTHCDHEDRASGGDHG